jgi:hypothetical protein
MKQNPTFMSHSGVYMQIEINQAATGMLSEGQHERVS